MTNKRLYLTAPKKIGLLEGNPYSLIYLAEWARRHSNCKEISIVDSIDKIQTKDECYVGISVTTPTYQESLDLAKRLKEKNSRIKVIFGGYHTKSQGNIIIDNPYVDFVVEGQGEKALIKILKGARPEVIYGTSLTRQELDSISVSDLSKFDYDYFKTMRQFGRMDYISTRGCTKKCSFCASSGRLIAKSAEKIVDDLETLVKVGEKEISIQDNYFGYNPARIRQICIEILKRGLEIDFDCQTRVESMQDKDLLRLMACAGCSAAWMGVENFYPETLRKMNKTREPEIYFDNARKAINNMLLEGIAPKIMFQVGFPYESLVAKDYNLSCLENIGRLSEKNSMLIYAHLNVVYPGTPDYQKIIKGGIPKDIFEAYTLWEATGKNKIKELLEENSLIHGSGGIPLGIINFDRLKNKDFDNMIDQNKLQGVKTYMQKIREISGISIYK